MFMELPAGLGKLPPCRQACCISRDMHKAHTHCQRTLPCAECASRSLCQAWADFVSRHGRSRPYAHFDLRVSLSMPSMQRYVTDPARIATHSFYPFIHFEKNFSRYGKNGRKKTRHIHYASHGDGCVYQRYAFLLNYHYNIWAAKNAIDAVAVAYRNNSRLTNIDIAKYAFDTIKKFPQCFVMVGDFTEFFDRIRHDYLKSMLCKVLGDERLPPDWFAVFKNITRFSSLDWGDIVKASGLNITDPGIHKIINGKKRILTKEQFISYKNLIKKNKLPIGIPQGVSFSYVLSNVYMIDIDKQINSYAASRNGLYIRYSDDFLIILPCEDNQEAEEYKNFIFSSFAPIKDLVHLQQEKTACYMYKDTKIYRDGVASHIDYLGFLFDGQKIRLRPRSITKYYYRMRRKARTIGRNNWISPTGKHITAKNMYGVYSCGGEKCQTFIDYARRARKLLNLDDPETDAVIKRHKRKIAQAIKKSMRRPS